MKKKVLILCLFCFELNARAQEVFTYLSDFTTVAFYGFADSAGNTKTAGKYNFIGKPAEGICEIWTGQKAVNNNNMLHGFAFVDGRELVPPKYSDVRSFSDGMAAVSQNYGKWGFINTKGTLVIPFVFTEVRSFVSGLAPVSTGFNGWKYIDKTGKEVIPGPFTRADTLSEGLAAVEVIYDMGNGVKGQHSGYIDAKGKMVIPASFNYGQPFRNGVAIVTISESTPVSKFYFTLIDKTGKRLNAKEYTDIRTHLVNGYYRCKLSKPGEPEKWEIIDKMGKEFPEEGVNSPAIFSEGLARFSKDNKWGFKDKAGNIVIPPQYAIASDFSEGLALVKTSVESMYGFINKKGEWVIKPMYFSAGSFHEGLSVVGIGKGYYDTFKKFGAIDKTGETVIPFEYNYLKEFINGRALAEKAGINFYLYKNGKNSLASDITTLSETRRAWKMLDKGDITGAIEIVKSLEEKNYPTALYLYGVILHQSPPPSQDIIKGMALITKAADAGLAMAANTLGLIYEKGMGVTVDLPKAALYYKKAADGGYPESMYRLALLYRDGKGVTKSESMFHSLIARSANKGFPAAVVMEDNTANNKK